MSDTTTAAATPPTSPELNPRRWRILAMLGVAQLMLILDVTVVAIALPHIGSDLGLSREALTWVVSGYTLAFGGLLLLGGRLADVFGARKVVLAGLVLFAAASLAGALAGAGAVLLVSRALQGVAAAAMSPAALSLVVTTFDGEERNKALGVWSALGGSGAALGVLLGGVLTSGPGWPWVFAINVPIGLLLAAGLIGAIPAARVTQPRGRIDVPGAVAVTVATGVLIYALIQAGDHGWLTWTTAGLVAGSVVLYLAFIARQRTAETPLLDLALLTRRPVASGALLIMIATALMITVFFLGSFYFQEVQGYSALHSGLLFLPVALATMLGANAAGRVIARTGARTMSVIGLVIAAAGMGLPAIVEGPGAMATGVAVAALGTGALFVVASATALGQVAPHEAGLASGIVSTFHEFGASVGAAAASSVAAAGIAVGSAVGFDRGFAMAAIVALVAGVISAVLVPGKPTSAPAFVDGPSVA